MTSARGLRVPTAVIENASFEHLDLCYMDNTIRHGFFAYAHEGLPQNSHKSIH